MKESSPRFGTEEFSNPSLSAFATLKRGYGVTKSASRHAKAGLDMYYVYSLKCKNGYYVGCTDNLKVKIDWQARWQGLC